MEVIMLKDKQKRLLSDGNLGLRNIVIINFDLKLKKRKVLVYR